MDALPYTPRLITPIIWKQTDNEEVIDILKTHPVLRHKIEIGETTELTPSKNFNRPDGTRKVKRMTIHRFVGDKHFVAGKEFFNTDMQKLAAESEYHFNPNSVNGAIRQLEKAGCVRNIKQGHWQFICRFDDEAEQRLHAIWKEEYKKDKTRR